MTPTHELRQQLADLRIARIQVTQAARDLRWAVDRMPAPVMSQASGGPSQASGAPDAPAKKPTPSASPSEPAPKAPATVKAAPAATAAPAPKMSLAARIAALNNQFDANVRDQVKDTGAATTPDAHDDDHEDGDASHALATIGGEIQIGADGKAFWGPIDNDSARAKAAGEKLIIDQIECIHCGTCVENTAAVFVLPNDSKAVVYRQEGPMDLIQDAIDACPVTCIHWTEDEGRFPQINDAEGNKLTA
jgi:ferredoxin